VDLIVDVVVEVEKSTGDLYYPKVPELTINKADPYQIDSATVRIAESGLGDVALHDDVSIVLNDQIYFVGTLGKRKASISKTNSSLEFPAKDYGDILAHTYVSTLRDWTSSTAIGVILENLRSSFVSSYLTGNNISTGPSIGAYNIPAWGKTLLQSYQELAEIAGYDLFIDTDADINFTTKNTVAKEGFSIIEDKNVIEISDYTEDKYQVRNYVKVIGDTGYSAYAEDTDSQDAYDKREHLYTDPSLGSNTACQAIADALIQAEPPINVSLIITGDLNVDPRDLVNVYIPKLDIDTTLRVTGVEQMIDINTFETSIELGSQPVDLGSIIAQMKGTIALLSGGYV